MNTTFPPIVVGTVATAISTESEVAVYCKITDFSGLEKADKVVLQEQYSIKPKEPGSKKGSIRVRKETFEGVDTYTLTTKVDQGSSTVDTNTEYTVTIDREYFDAFKSVSSGGMLKTRYIFGAKSINLRSHELVGLEASNTKFEVDVFKDAAGNMSSWCKIDVELDDVLKQAYTKLPPESKVKLVLGMSNLPFKPTDLFTNKTNDPTQRQILDHLYKYIFTLQKQAA